MHWREKIGSIVDIDEKWIDSKCVLGNPGSSEKLENTGRIVPKKRIN